MAGVLRQLLKLPAPMRCEALAHPSLLSSAIETQPLRINGFSLRRALHSTRFQLQRTQPGRPPPPKPSRKAAEPRSTFPSPSSPPPGPPPRGTGNPLPYLLSLARTNGQVLLYRAPSHVSLYFNSYILGGVITLGAVNFMWISSFDPPGEQARPSRYLKTVSAGLGIVLAILGVRFFLTPVKMIRSISLIPPPATGASGTRLRIELKPPFPFIKLGGGTIDTPASRVFVDRQVAAAEDISFSHVPLSSAEAFTAEHLQPPAKFASGGVRNIFRAVLRALGNAFPALFLNTRRMFIRDGIAYVRIQERGVWKMDLQGCELLDAGRPIERVMVIDETHSRGLAAWVRSKVGSPGERT